MEPDGVGAQSSTERAGGRGVGASGQAGPGAGALDSPALAQRGHPTTPAASPARGGRASTQQRSAAVWTTAQARSRPPAEEASAQAPQGECEQTAPSGVAAGVDQRREPGAF